MRVTDKQAAKTDVGIREAVDKAEKELGETGRVVLRPSGTEPVVRVMVEAGTDEQANDVCSRLAKVVEDRLA